MKKQYLFVGFMLAFLAGCNTVTTTSVPARTSTASIPQQLSAEPTQTPTRTLSPTEWHVEPIVTPSESRDNEFDISGFGHLPPSAELSEAETAKLKSLIDSSFSLPGDFFNIRYPLDPSVTLIPVNLSSTQLGLYKLSFFPTGGSGIYPIITHQVYIWENDTLRCVWSWQYYGGGKAGLYYQDWNAFYVRFEFLTGSDFADIVVEQQTRGVNAYGEVDKNHLTYLPGNLVYSWDGERYTLKYFYDDERLISIHAQERITMAPYMSLPLIVDGLSNDWYQVEYYMGGFSWATTPDDLSIEKYYGYKIGSSVSWDENFVYLFINGAHRNSTIHIGMDTDLFGDFREDLIGADDYTFLIEFPDWSDASTTLRIKPLSPAAQNVHITAVLHENQPWYTLEIAMPRSELGLSGELVNTPGWVEEYQSYGHPLREYHPTAGQVIGYVTISTDIEPLLNIDINNPTTWGTLIFISDH